MRSWGSVKKGRASPRPLSHGQTTINLSGGTIHFVQHATVTTPRAQVAIGAVSERYADGAYFRSKRGGNEAEDGRRARVATLPIVAAHTWRRASSGTRGEGAAETTCPPEQDAHEHLCSRARMKRGAARSPARATCHSPHTATAARARCTQTTRRGVPSNNPRLQCGRF